MWKIKFRSLIGVVLPSKLLFEETFSKRDRLKVSSLVMQDVNHQLFTDSGKSEVRLGVRTLKNQKKIY